jgi:pyridoxal phosphate enzyme (YggS family)
MAVLTTGFEEVLAETRLHHASLVAVSKTKPVSDILELYHLGHRDFAENYVQELVDKQPQLPADLRWHFIGHLQSNKVKYIAPFVHLIHGVDSFKLLKEIDKQASRFNRRIKCLLQLHIAEEETKFGLSEEELDELLTQFIRHPLLHVEICGLMAMASFTTDTDKVRLEFRKVKSIFDAARKKHFPANDSFREISMGMSGDFRIALAEGSTMIRVGSLIFGER